VPLPLIPLLGTVAASTIAFTSIGLAFGAALGQRYEHLAERAAGDVPILLAAAFTLQHALGWTHRRSLVQVRDHLCNQGFSCKANA
jgi:UDP-glucose 4-epimerase